ncbi:unnamed protein product [Prorocentrum cordatum]|uniref:Uncharacterized protein n=1 Tax=Prorocentrum cordatum TaxID=2364126 RepID=A0ABN9RQ14_9DINO|nr:unnamed protein product [Polarella glacialis]
MGGGRRGMTTPQVIASSWEPGQTIIRGLAGRQTSCAKVNTAPSVRLTSLGNELTTCMRICLQRDAATNSMPPRQRQARQKRPGKIQGEELEMTVDCYHPVSLPSRPSAHLALARTHARQHDALRRLALSSDLGDGSCQA